MNDYSGYGEIKIGDKTLPFKFGTNAYRLLCQHRNIDLHQIGEAFKDPFAIIELAYFAYVTAVRMANSVTEISLDTFIELVGDEKDIIPEFEKLIVGSKMWGYTVSELTDKAEKKKSDTVA
jgi:hypothetical protein